LIRVLVVDDHSVVRRGIAQIAAETTDIAVSGEAESAEDALRLARQEEYDVAILDIALPGRSGLDIIRDLRAIKPAIGIVVLSMYSEEQYAVRSLRDGASAYLSKTSPDSEVVSAIRAASTGHRFITSKVGEQLAYYVERDNDASPHDRLSGREYQVFALIGSGLGLARIAERLCLSPKTVSTYRSRILGKMGMESNAQLVRYAVENRLVP
jgi:two-component system, NarL family, invasion response regulator UvrY